MDQRDGPRVYVLVEAFDHIVCARLVVHVVIRIGKAPENGGIPHIFCDLQRAFTVFSLWRPEERIHFISGRLFHVIGISGDLFPDGPLIIFRHADMVGCVIAHHMPFFFHSLHKLWLVLDKMFTHEKGGGSFMFFEYIQNPRRVAILITTVEGEKDRLFSALYIGLRVPGVIPGQVDLLLNLRYRVIFISLKPPPCQRIREGVRIRGSGRVVYVAIGAHTDKKLGIPGEDAKGVVSAVQMLREIGEGNKPDFTGKNVIVVGGGNVAMDATRSAIRLGANNVSVLYRRRKADMTALEEEIEAAIAEGAEILELHAPKEIETDENGHVTAMVADPKIIGLISGGRPAPADSGRKPIHIPCDIVIIAIGQDIVSDSFARAGLPVKRGRILASDDSSIPDTDGVFAGGDCVSGPATVIRAIAAGKVAAANIDNYLGYNHIIESEVKVPDPRIENKSPCGRVTMMQRNTTERKQDFELVEKGMSEKEATQEARRCLRCDHFGYGVFKGGRVEEW